MKKKYLYLDFLRIFSMFAVIFLHTVADLLRTNYQEFIWHFSNILSSLFSTSVPIFFMISGALLLSDDKSLSVIQLYKVRLKKICIPFIFWSVFAVLYYFIVDVSYYGNFNYDGIIYRLKHIFSQPVTIHLWFMYALIPIYILLPYIKLIVDNANKNHIRYIFILWIIFSVFLTTAQNLVTDNYKIIFQMNNQFSLNIIGGYLGFFILGYYIHNNDIKIKKRWLSIYIILDILIVSAGTYFLTTKTGAYFEGFKVYCGFFTSSMSIALFLLFKDIFKNTETIKHGKLISVVSDTSFAIYLIHNLVIHFMNINYFIVPNNSFIHLILRFIAVYFVSFVIVYILKLIKPMCFITTGIKYKGLKKYEKN